MSDQSQAHSITPPSDQDGSDSAACQTALETSFVAITSDNAVSMGSAAGAEIPEELQDLIDQAVNAGWERPVAEDAIRTLARELLGAKGAAFD